MIQCPVTEAVAGRASEHSGCLPVRPFDATPATSRAVSGLVTVAVDRDPAASF